MSFKNRGMLLESVINKTIVFYAHHDIAIFHKKEIPIRFSGLVNNKTMQIEKAFINAKSTTDYYGIYMGQFYAFEAKSTMLGRLPLENIKMHQLAYLQAIDKHRGQAFFIVGFINYNRFFVLPVNNLKHHRKLSITLAEMTAIGIEVTIVYPGIIDFIACFKK